jgi:hypothetical protein
VSPDCVFNFSVAERLSRNDVGMDMPGVDGRRQS